jgi:tryptophan synthase alpha chain
MNKTSDYIKEKKGVLSVYFTAEYPAKGDTRKVILSLQKAGVDMIELGIPFSDPLADGPVIQHSSTVALQNGFTVDGLLADLEAICEQVSIPLVPMGYFNTFLQYGVERFLSRCRDLKIDTIIIPDLPPDIYEKQYRAMFHTYGVSPVFLITPQTNDERITFISTLSEAFIYAVADNSITGNNRDISEGQLLYFEKISRLGLHQPVMIGFGISTGDHFRTACQYADGAIIGSAFIRVLGSGGEVEGSIRNFVKGIRSTPL